MFTRVRRASPIDGGLLLALLQTYYNEWDIWQRDDEAAVLDALSRPLLGYFIAEVDGEPAGCVLLKPLLAIAHAVECKRLFVASAFRGHRLADALMDAAESAARTAGYSSMYLDTKAEFAAAIKLYKRRGYQEIERYNDNPQATIFLCLALS